MTDGLSFTDIVRQADFPVYALMPQTLNLRAYGMSYGVTRLNSAQFNYCGPNLHHLSHSVSILSSSHRFELYNYMVSVMRSNTALPLAYEPSFDWGELNVLWDTSDVDHVHEQPLYRWLHKIPWQLHHEREIPFAWFHWDQPALVSLAWCDNAVKGHIALAAFGFSQPEFLVVLNAVVQVRPESPLLARVQHDFDLGNQEIERRRR